MGKDEWQRTAEVLTKKREQPGYIVKVHYDADGIVSMIYLQTPSQRDMFCRYGKLLQLDGTYKITKVNFPLYTLLVEDSFGVGQPVAHAFLRNETTDDILQFLRYFAKVNDAITLCSKAVYQIYCYFCRRKMMLQQPL
jgi:hypothetical protein